MADVAVQTSDAFLTTQVDGYSVTIQVRGKEWRRELEAASCTSFRFQHSSGSFTARCERKKGHWYWYAYRRAGGRLRKAYLGKLKDVTLARMLAVAARLAQHVGTQPVAKISRVSRVA